MNNITCSCGASKAPRARVCFRCLAAEPQVVHAYVRQRIPGEAGPRFFAYRVDGTSRTFYNRAQAAQWAEGC